MIFLFDKVLRKIPDFTQFVKRAEKHMTLELIVKLDDALLHTDELTMIFKEFIWWGGGREEEEEEDAVCNGE